MGRLTESTGRKHEEPEQQKVYYGPEIVIGPDYYEVQLIVPSAREEIRQDYIDALRNNNQSE